MYSWLDNQDLGLKRVLKSTTSQDPGRTVLSLTTRREIPSCLSEWWHYYDTKFKNYCDNVGAKHKLKCARGW